MLTHIPWTPQIWGDFYEIRINFHSGTSSWTLPPAFPLSRKTKNEIETQHRSKQN
jgi:hypothetical protein